MSIANHKPKMGAPRKAAMPNDRRRQALSQQNAGGASTTVAKTSYADVVPFITKDGSEIREIMHPKLHGNVAQSLAEATIPPGTATFLHCHHLSEEIYHVCRGEGRMHLGGKDLRLRVGDTVAIPPGTPHNVRNTGSEPLVILCACTPPYAHEDTELL